MRWPIRLNRRPSIRYTDTGRLVIHRLKPVHSLDKPELSPVTSPDQAVVFDIPPRGPGVSSVPVDDFARFRGGPGGERHAGIDARVDTGFDTGAENGPELPASSGNSVPVHREFDRSFVESAVSGCGSSVNPFWFRHSQPAVHRPYHRTRHRFQSNPIVTSGYDSTTTVHEPSVPDKVVGRTRRSNTDNVLDGYSLRTGNR